MSEAIKNKRIVLERVPTDSESCRGCFFETPKATCKQRDIKETKCQHYSKYFLWKLVKPSKKEK